MQGRFRVVVGLELVQGRLLQARYKASNLELEVRIGVVANGLTSKMNMAISTGR